MKKLIQPAGWLISILIPFILIMFSVRLLLTPTFIQSEYNRKNFPTDQFGFSKEERTKWALLSLEYLLNNEEPSFLADLELDDGHPLYEEREVSHMLDVKMLINQSLYFWNLSLLFLLLMGILSRRHNWQAEFWHFFARGGVITILLILAVILGVIIGFDAVFTGFHKIFFTGDTWLFRYSDSLIRLFPIQFWQDAFIMMGVFTLSGGALFTFLGKRNSERNLKAAESEQKQE